MYLNNVNMVGTIPTEIGLLESLQYLTLDNNSLIGTVPSEIASLSSLYELHLRYNDLKGTIPSSIFSNSMTFLRYLHLDHNSFTGAVPNDIISLASLYSLQLEKNQFTGDILHGSPLCGLRLVDSMKILTADCDGHGFVEVNCECCTSCYESRNIAMLSQQKTVLEELFEVTNGALWRAKTNWLVSIDECDWYGIYCDGEGYVVNIDLDYNYMTGMIPSSIGMLPYLSSLTMGGNTLSGSLPSEIGLIYSLRILELDYNMLTGSLPTEIGLLSELYYLRLDHNSLTGTLPSTMNNMASLEDVQLDYNYLSGTISDEIFGNALLPLYRLNLERNHFTGSILASGDICKLRVMNEGLNTFSTDCHGNEPEVDCDCCSSCFQSREVSKLSTQKSALEALFNATNGPLWTTKTNWLVHPDECTWYGVDCDSEGYVDNIYLMNINMDGTLPSEIGQLVYLDYLLLSYSSLSGTIPSEIGLLTSIGYLHLTSGNMVGSIPTEMGQLKSLDFLKLGNNDLIGTIPTELAGLTSLDFLDLQLNSLTGTIPVGTLASLTLLRRLYLFRNDLSGSILFDEPLCGLRTENFGKLDTIYTDCLGDDPEVQCDCCTSCEQSRNVGQHEVDKAVLEALYQGTNGESWRTKTNWLVDPNVCTWHGISCDSEGYVQIINLKFNTLQGIIPAELGLLSYLSALYLNNNLLSGTVPSEIGQLPSLIRCYLHTNSLTGMIPSEIGQLKSVTIMDLSTNQLTGTIPNTIGEMRSMYTFHVDYNYLSGTVPVEAFASLKNLDNLYLHRNELTGAILVNQDAICGLRSTYTGGSLKYLYADCLGDDPEVQCECCTTCYESRNPDEIAVQKLSLEALFQNTNGTLWTNNGNWLVDANVCTWFGVSCDAEGYVTSINMYSNNVVGSMPSEMGALRYLTLFRLTSNSMSGSIPSEFGNLSSLATMDFSRNSFVGTIPSHFFSTLPSLRTLNLSYNAFSGTLPVTATTLENLSSLQYLSLQHNALTGPIPAKELGGLPSLINLFLQRNLFTGAQRIEFGSPLCDLRFVSLSRLHTDCATANDNVEVLCDCCTSCSPSELPPGATSAWPTKAASGSPVVAPTVSSTPSITPPDIAAQKSVLEGFFDAMNGPSWSSNTNWLVNPNICTWVGVGCDSVQESVLSLRLPQNRLSGSIPKELAQLSKLTDLRLYSNTITGSLPSEIGVLTSLNRLWLNNNSLTGTIPSEVGQLTSMRYLYLHQNSLVGTLPDEMTSLKDMRTLYLSYNSLSGTVPVNLLASMSTNLNQIYLEKNVMTGAILSGSALCEARLIHGLSTLRVDCLGMLPEIECECCTSCYESRNPGVRSIQKSVLEGIYEATGGPSWTLNTNWIVGTEECDWYGVNCDGEGYITSLSLNVNKLSGTVSSEIGQLSYISTLRMYSNSLRGTIPSEIGMLPSLYTWDMYSNALVGTIPSEIGLATSLHSINLLRNYLTGTIPTTIAGLAVNLRSLDLTYNLLTGTIPLAALGSLTNLNSLRLEYNELVGNATYTDDLCQLRTTGSLSTFRVDCLGTLPEIECECCSSCHESRNPVMLSKQKQVLEDLYEATNGTLWSTRTNWLVGPEECDWYGVTCDNEGYIRSLSLGSNLLKGTIPTNIGMLPYLDTLYLGSNMLIKSIPSEIGMLQSLEYMDLRGNSLSGTIPSEIGKLTELYNLELRGNALSGTIPTTMSKLTSLGWLELQYNSLSGTVPVEALGNENLPNLRGLYLQKNHLTGSIAAFNSLCQSRTITGGLLSDLYMDCLGSDTDTAEIACHCCNRCYESRNVANRMLQRAALESLYQATNGPSWRYSSNWLVSGSDECDWYGVSCDNEGYVYSVDLDYSSMSGTLPSSIGTLAYLRTLSLISNTIGGTLPSEIGMLRSLEYLNLEHNDYLTGTIPSEIGALRVLNDLILQDNALTGTIPTEIARLSSLRYLELQFNLLTGTVPLADLGSMSSLTNVRLHRNELTMDNNNGISFVSTLCAMRLANLYELSVDCGTVVDNGLQKAEVACDCCTYCHQSRDPTQLTLQKAALEALYQATNGALWTSNANWLVNPDVCTWYGVGCDSEGYVSDIIFYYNNKLDGTLPSEVGALPYLEQLQINNNPSLTGTIPSEIGQLTLLNTCNLEGNALSGTIPSEIGALFTSLRTLDLADNSLTGTLPASAIGLLQSLSYVYLNDNSFTGTIPTLEFSNLKKLNRLYLQGNDFTGTIASTSSMCLLRYDDLISLRADCATNNNNAVPEVQCACCTVCYEQSQVNAPSPIIPAPTPTVDSPVSQPPPIRSPTASPTAFPTFTPAITTSVTSPSTFETDYDNTTQFMDYLADFDAGFKDHLEEAARALIAAYDESSGDDDYYYYYGSGDGSGDFYNDNELYRRQKQKQQHRALYTLLVIAQVNSEVVGTGGDGTSCKCIALLLAWIDLRLIDLNPPSTLLYGRKINFALASMLI